MASRNIRTHMEFAKLAPIYAILSTKFLTRRNKLLRINHSLREQRLIFRDVALVGRLARLYGIDWT